jgi:hypothetical protein
VYAVRSKSGRVLCRCATRKEAESFVRSQRSPTGSMTRAEAKRRGEIKGSQHALGWIERNHPGREELESAIVSQSAREEWADVARGQSYDVGIYGGGARVEANRRAFVEGYVEALIKELKREYGRIEGSPRRAKSPQVVSSLRTNRDELHAMTMVLVRQGIKDPAAKAWRYQQHGVSLPELEFRLQAGERMSPRRKRR